MTVKAMPFNERNIPFQTEADVVARMSAPGHQRTSSAFVADVPFRAVSGHRTSDSNDVAWLGWFAPVNGPEPTPRGAHFRIE